jgi:protein-tyrosine phosphatase
MSGITDWHSHVLPNMDDGSKNIEESLSMIRTLMEQGVTRVIATPHFYANDESVETFLKRRDRAYQQLLNAMPEDFPRVICGAEVSYYPGVSRMQELDRLTIGDSKLLLLEMPMTEWTELTVKEIIDLAHTRNFNIILAHIDRYMSFQKNDLWYELRENGILMQFNASYFGGLLKKHKALSFLDSGIVQFVGSDCHNMTTRAPRIDRAYKAIDQKMGNDYILKMNEYNDRMLGIK